jgi:hypothetical protein
MSTIPPAQARSSERNGHSLFLDKLREIPKSIKAKAVLAFMVANPVLKLLKTTTSKAQPKVTTTPRPIRM